VKATLLVIAALSLAGCSSTPTVYEGEQTEKDRLPAIVLSEGNTQEYDLESSRYLGTAKGRDFYAVWSAESGNCIATVAGESGEWNAACSPRCEMTFGGSGVEGRFFPGGYPEDSLEEGWISVHPTLRVQE
jgi:hypothetical protein